MWPLKFESLIRFLTEVLILDIESKILVVGLTPEYYSSSVSMAVSDYQASMRSTNMGACFITRSLVSIFNADYLDIASDYNISDIRNNYDVCIVALASHLGPSRNVSQLVKFLKSADLRTVFLSGGLDAGQDGSDEVHQSVKELLDLCSVDNQWIGVRGSASALYLHRQGVENVVPIGCPTMYSKYFGEISPLQTDSKEDIAIPFHWTIAAHLMSELDEHTLVGQDVMDEELFLEYKNFRISRNISERFGIPQKEVQSKLKYAVSKNGFFPESYEAWYDKIGSQKALLSGRLHAAICGLTQGVPTVLSYWDLRTREIVDYFKLPSVSGEEVRKLGSLSALKRADFESFNQRQKVCWGRWSEFLSQNNIDLNGNIENTPFSSVSNFNASFKNDNDLLKTASYLHPQRKFPNFYHVSRALRFLKRNANVVFRKLRLS